MERPLKKPLKVLDVFATLMTIDLLLSEESVLAVPNSNEDGPMDRVHLRSRTVHLFFRFFLRSPYNYLKIDIKCIWYSRLVHLKNELCLFKGSDSESVNCQNDYLWLIRILSCKITVNNWNLLSVRTKICIARVIKIIQRLTVTEINLL